jgi:formate hydrogenlyase subunit 3/multisubunit Na+/H+ antiporter MnhD subunit
VVPNHPVSLDIKICAVLATAAGVAITVWVARSGTTTVGKGLTKRTISRRSDPWAFTFEVIKLALATAVIGSFAAYLMIAR